MKPHQPTLRRPTRPSRPNGPARADRQAQSGARTAGERGTSRWDGVRSRISDSWSTSAIGGAPRWAAGLAAGVQAAALSLLVVIAPALATYVATSADPANAGVGWQRSVVLASSLWLLAHGVPLVTTGATVTLMPLGLTGIAVFACYASARRSGRATRSGYVAAVAGYAACALLVALVVARTAQGVTLAVLGAGVVGAIGLGAGLLARPGAPVLRDVTRAGWIRVPELGRVGVAGGVLALAWLVLVAAAVVLAWVLGGRTTITDILNGLSLDPVGGVVLGLGEATFAPNLMVWAMAWVAGPGFAVGTGSAFTVGSVVAGPIPALPLLGALPQPESVGGVLRWVPVAVVLAGALAGWWSHRRRLPGEWWHPFVVALTTAVTAGLGAAALVGLASGAGGPGRMLDIGASAFGVGAAVTGEVLLGALLVVLPADQVIRSTVAGALRRTPGLGRPGSTSRGPTSSGSTSSM